MEPDRHARVATMKQGDSNLSVQAVKITISSASEVPKAPVGSDPALDVHKDTLNTAKNAAAQHERLKLLKIRSDKWLEMLSQWEIWNATKPGRIKARCRKGIPDALRGRAWLAMVSADRDERRIARPAWYSELLRGATPIAASLVSLQAMGLEAFINNGAGAGDGAPVASIGDAGLLSEAVSAIERDLARTLPHVRLFAAKPRDSRAPESGGEGDGENSDEAHARGHAYVSSTIGQASLFRVLLAVAASDPTVGYCQGMGFPAALWLCYVPEEDAFWAMYAMMQGAPDVDVRFWSSAALTGCDIPVSCAAAAGGDPQAVTGTSNTIVQARHRVLLVPGMEAPDGGRAYDLQLRGLYEGGLPLLSRVQHVLAGLIRARLPKLGDLFSGLGLHPSMYAAQWAMTQFLYSWPFHVVVRAWDVILWEGWKGWFRVALAYLILGEKHLLAAAEGKYAPLPSNPAYKTPGLTGFEGVMVAFRDLPTLAASDCDRLMTAATRAIVGFSRAELIALNDEYDRYVEARKETCGTDAGACLMKNRGGSVVGRDVSSSVARGRLASLFLGRRSR